MYIKELNTLAEEYVNKRDVDKEFARTTYNILKERMPSLKPYLSDNIKVEKVSDEVPGSLADYNRETGEVRIFIDTLNQRGGFYSPYLAQESIRHELEHANHVKIIKENRHDTQSFVVINSVNIDPITHDINPIGNCVINGEVSVDYFIHPLERLAHIKSRKFMVSQLRYKTYSVELEIARKRLYEAYARGYLYNGFYFECPAYEFYTKYRMFVEYYGMKHMAEDYKDNLENRLLYGLPVRQDEVPIIINDIARVRDSRCLQEFGAKREI